MKKENESLERLLSWARDGAPTEQFAVSPSQKAAVLAACRGEWAGGLNDGLALFFRWALASSLAIMGLVILFNYQALLGGNTVELEHSPQMMFHARMASEFYIP